MFICESSFFVGRVEVPTPNEEQEMSFLKNSVLYSDGRTVCVSSVRPEMSVFLEVQEI